MTEQDYVQAWGANLRVPDADGGILTGGDDGPVAGPPHGPVNPPRDAGDHKR